MFGTIKSIIEEHLGINDPSKITLKSQLDDFDADSIDVVEIMMAIEDEFDIEIPDEIAEQFVTIQDIVDFIEEQATL